MRPMIALGAMEAVLHDFSTMTTYLAEGSDSERTLLKMHLLPMVIFGNEKNVHRHRRRRDSGGA
jgi:hypothetical protein